MQRVLRIALTGLFTITGVLQAAGTQDGGTSTLKEPSAKPAAPAGNEDVYSVYAPWVVLGVLAVGGVIAGLAASNSGRS